MLQNFLELDVPEESSIVHLDLLKVLFPLKLISLENAGLTFKIYAKQKHPGCKKRRGQSEAAVIK